MARGKKGSRKGSRKAQRRANRKAGRKSRKAQRRRSQRGGWLVLNPAGVNQNPMISASSASHAQGADYQRIHAGQHGGGAPIAGAPVGYTGVLDSSLRDIARVGAIDNAMNQIQGMSDQSGGARRRRGRKASRKATRKGRKASRKSRKSSRKANRKGSRRMRGGAALHPADYSAPGTLLSGAMASKALMTMNPEWKLAENPASFAPSR